MLRLTKSASLVIRRLLMCAAGLLGVTLVVIVVLGAALDSGHFQGPLIRYFADRSGRPLKVDGTLKVRVLSLHPFAIAEHLTIGNPSWMPAGTTAQIGKLTLVVDTPWFGRSLSIEKLEMEGVTLHLARDAKGHSNWRPNPPGVRGGGGLPIIRSFSMPDAHVELNDARRHLQFQGTVSAYELNAADALRPLRIEGKGQLNGRAATFAIDGAPLAMANRATPYPFDFVELSGDSRLTGKGFLPNPFDFTVLDTGFDAIGPDLKDLYFLTGVTLVHTGSYHLTGKLSRRGRISRFSELAVTSGKSDIRGSVSIETTSGRPKFRADLDSQVLRLADIGARAAGRVPANAIDPPLLLSDATLKPATVRRGDGVVNFHARRIDVGHVPLQAVAAKMTIDKGVISVAPLLGDVLDGKFTAQLRLDATTDNPVADVDLKITDLQLAEFLRKGMAEPAMEGPLRVRVIVKGHGSSVHQVAASSNGTVTAVLPHGSLRAALAELTGIDLGGLGLLLAKSDRGTAVHCGVASFRAEGGVLTSESLVVDTESVLITGKGKIDLESEAVDLMLYGHPKGVRLGRLHAPVQLRGTLAHLSAGIQVGHAMAQTAGAVALGIVLTPLASILAFVDPGLAKDADCAALLGAAKTLDTRPAAAATDH
ncbi:MAG: AsmA family protein [Gammaproteobacteria bacterium]